MLSLVRSQIILPRSLKLLNYDACARSCLSSDSKLSCTCQVDFQLHIITSRLFCFPALLENSLTDIVKSMLSPSPLKVEPTAENMYDAKVNTQVADKAEPVRQNGRPRIGSLINLIVKQKRKRNIGITISIRINETSVWTNGNLFVYTILWR